MRLSVCIRLFNVAALLFAGTALDARQAVAAIDPNLLDGLTARALG